MPASISPGRQNQEHVRVIRAANDNPGGRRVRVRLRPPRRPCIAEIEVFGAFLAEIEAMNDNVSVGYAS